MLKSPERNLVKNTCVLLRYHSRIHCIPFFKSLSVVFLNTTTKYDSNARFLYPFSQRHHAHNTNVYKTKRTLINSWNVTFQSHSHGGAKTGKTKKEWTITRLKNEQTYFSTQYSPKIRELSVPRGVFLTSPFL